MSSKVTACPVCKKPAALKTRPFCSVACRDRDLLQWLGEGYRVAGPPAEDDMQKIGDYGLDSERD